MHPILNLEGALELAGEIQTHGAHEGWTLAEVMFLGHYEGEAKYRVRAINGHEMIETTSYVPWKLLLRQHERANREPA